MVANTYRLQALATVLVALAVAGGAVQCLRYPAVFDDAYISFRYAANLASGRGLVYNGSDLDDRVEGYSNFLWVLLAAGAIALGLDPVTACRSLGVAAYLAAIAVVGALVAWRARAWRDLAALPLVGALVLPRGLAAVAGSGLETLFVGLLILLMGLAHHAWTRRDLTADAVRAILPLLVVLTRLDGGIAVAASAAATLARHRADGASLGTAIAVVGRRFAPTAAGLIAWSAWRLHYYGDLLPNPYRAKGADQWSVDAGLAYLAAFVANSPQVLVLLSAAALAVVLLRRAPHGGFAIFCGLAILGHAAYVAKVGGDFMYYRFAFEMYPLLVAAAALGLRALAGARPVVALTVAVAALALSATPPVLESRYAMQSVSQMHHFARAGREVGRRLRDTLPPDTRIATRLAGTVPYYSGLPTIDEWGLNDRHIAGQPSTPILYRGHVKEADEAYLRDRGVNLVLGHPRICSCAAPCTADRRQVFVRLRGDRCLRTHYLVESPALTAHVCRRPDLFTLHRVLCPPA